MTRNGKIMGLVVVAALAISAVAASAASAHVFKAEVSPTRLTGTQETNHVFSVSGFNVECKKAMFNGTQATSPASTVTVHPEYSECEFFEEPAAVDTEGCNYVFTGTTDANGDAAVELECETGKEIKVTTSSCNMGFRPQTTGKGVHYTNIGSGATSEVTVTATATANLVKLSGSLCFLLGNSGEYTGAAKVQGFKDEAGGAQVGVSIE